MAAPKTWLIAELLTASDFNGEFRDRFNNLAKKDLLLGAGDIAGPALTTGVKAYFRIKVPMRITGWSLFADAVGSIVLDIWRDTWANAPPTVADSITGTEKPTLTNAQKAEDLALGTWSPDVSDGDVLALNVDSTSGVIKLVILTLHGTHLSFV